MNAVIAPARPGDAVISQRAELINRAVLGTIADAWISHPSEVPVPSPGTGEQEIFERALGLFAQEGLVRLAGNSISLTDSGCDAVQQASSRDHRLAELLQSGSLPAEESGSSSLVVAILRARFEQRCAPTRLSASTA